MTWLAPLPVSPPASTAKIYFEKLAIADGKVVTAYADDRFEVSGQGAPMTTTPFVRVFDTSNWTFGPEIQVPTGTLVGNTGDGSFDFSAVEVPGPGFAWSFEAALDSSLLAIVYENLSGSWSEAWAVTSNDGGAINPISLSGAGVPPGLTIYAIGISFDIASADFVDISGVVRLET